MTKIDYFFSVLSPFTYLAGDKLEQVATRHNAAINYRPMDIMELFGRTGGVPPRDRHQSRQAYRLQDLSRIAKLSGMDINLAPAFWPTDAVPASCVIIDAGEDGSGDVGALVRSILRACWAEERNIAEPEVISDLLSSAGFPAGVMAADRSRSLRQYTSNTADAVSSNVFGSPTYVAEDQVFWGQDRLDHLEAWLEGRLA